MTSLTIGIWNANGLSPHKRELQKFLSEHKIDIMLIQETHFTVKNRFYIRGYIVYDTKHPMRKARGGTAILVKRGIKHHELPKHSYRRFQATSISVADKFGQITFSSIYCPPNFKWKADEFTEYFGALGDRFLAGGDYNAKHTYWGSRLCTPRGHRLLQSVIKNNLMCLSPNAPTHWPGDIKKNSGFN